MLPTVIAACEAVAFAHGQRVIHSDLTPSNILVGAYGETVVIDWGLAKDLSAGRGGGKGPPAGSNAPEADDRSASCADPPQVPSPTTKRSRHASARCCGCS